MVQKKTAQKTVQKTAPKTEHNVVRRTGSWLWSHKGHVAHWAMIVGGVILMVSGANKLVFGRVFPK